MSHRFVVRITRDHVLIQQAFTFIGSIYPKKYIKSVCTI